MIHLKVVWITSGVCITIYVNNSYRPVYYYITPLLCVYQCVCVCVCVHVHARVYVCVCVCMCMFVCVLNSVCAACVHVLCLIYMSAFVCVHVHQHTKNACVHVHEQVCAFVCHCVGVYYQHIGNTMV